MYIIAFVFVKFVFFSGRFVCHIATKFIYHILTISSLFGSFLEIYKENGILGYYAGLIPRIIGSAAVIVLTGISTYAINNYVIQEPAMKPYTASTMKVSFNIFQRERAPIRIIDTTCFRTNALNISYVKFKHV